VFLIFFGCISASHSLLALAVAHPTTAGMEASPMLVLSRKESETIVFTTLGITVEVVKISGGKVRLGIKAPADVPVHRQEVAERLARESASADEHVQPVFASV
jgi:carbon storage regulator